MATASPENIRSHMQSLEQQLDQLRSAAPAEAYRHKAEELARIRQMYEDQMSKVISPPILTMEEAEMRKVFAKIGISRTKSVNQMAPATAANIAEIFTATAKWHRAAIKVFEYMGAQMNMDLFKDDPEAKRLYERVMVEGFRKLHSEAENFFG